MLLALFFLSTNAENILVTVQTKSQDEMDALTAAIDADIQNAAGPMRTTLGTIEATMSRVVDTDSDYLQTTVRSVPTLSMLNDVQYDTSTDIWTFTYQSMRIDPDDPLNLFNRVLYMTKSGNSGLGDTNNICLQAGIDSPTCLAQLQSSYTVPETLQTGQDYLTFHGPIETDIVSTYQNIENNLLQTVTIQVPHSRIRTHDGVLEPLSRAEEIQHPIEGIHKHYIFGIGMLFYGAGNNQIVFDQFDIIENNREQMAIERHNSYLIAQRKVFVNPLHNCLIEMGV